MSVKFDPIEIDRLPEKQRVYANVLLLLSQGLSQFEIRQKLGISKQLVSYHVNKAVKQGLFTVEKIGNTKVYHKTPLLDQYLHDLTRGACPPPPKPEPRKPGKPEFSPISISEILEKTLPRIHLLQLQLNVQSAPSATVRRQIGTTSITIQSSQRTILVTATSDFPGLDLWGFELLIDTIRTMIRELTGKEYLESDFYVVNFQVNTDIQGLRIDGAKSITLTDLHGALVRMYQKTEKALRVEWQADAKSVEELVQLMRGGVATYQVWQAIYMLTRDVRDLSNAIKFMNERQLHMAKLQEEITKAMITVKELLEEISKRKA